jgi:6-phosphogluconolactonase
MPQAAPHRLIVCPDADSLAARVADQVIEAGAKAVAARGRFCLALTGGSTPEKMYGLLAQPGRAGRVDWDRVFVFVGDERFVPYDDPRSNYGMARRAMLAHVPLPADHLFPMRTDVASAAASAEDYTRTLAGFFGVQPGQGLPHIDLVLLGLGEDGHCASLFPGMPTLHETGRWVTDSPAGTLPPPVERVTLTFPVLNAAREVLFLVSGDKKAPVVRDVLEGNPPVEKRPSVGVRPAGGELVWVLDEAAAALLSAGRRS